jgi:hypothetical protein
MVCFQQNLGQTSGMDPNCHHNFFGHQQPMGHNKQESTTFILPFPYGSNKQHCMDKEEVHWVYGVMQGWFSAKLGSKIIDGSQLSAQFLGPPTATVTQQTGINHFYSSIWIQQTALCGQGRVYGVMQGWFSAKLGSKISDGSQLSAQFLGPPTATVTQQTGINHFYSSIWIQ